MSALRRALRWVRESNRKGNLLPLGYLRDHGPPAPRDAVRLPHVNGIGFEADGLGQQLATAKAIDEFCMTHARTIITRYLGLSTDFESHKDLGDGAMALRNTLGMPDSSDLTYAQECGRRLRRTRFALGHNVLRRFAKLTGVAENRIGNWENGLAMVPQEYVQQLRELLGPGSISHDWIFGGDPSALRPDIQKKLLTEDKNAPGTDE